MKIPVLLRPVALGAHLFGAFCVGLAVFLGFWQLGSWSDHRQVAIDKAGAEAVAQEPVPMVDVFGPDEPFQKAQVGRVVSVSGTWLPESTVYVADRERHGEQGWWVITPVAVQGSESAIPVVRGWTDAIEPRPAAPTGTTELVGWLQPPEGARGLHDDDARDDVIPQVRLADLVQHVDQDIYGGYLLLDHSVADEGQPVNGTEGLASVDLTQVPEVSATTGWRNFLYAVEWWIFAGFALFIWVRWCRDEIIASRTPSDAEHADVNPVAADA